MRAPVCGSTRLPVPSDPGMTPAAPQTFTVVDMKKFRLLLSIAGSGPKIKKPIRGRLAGEIQIQGQAKFQSAVENMIYGFSQRFPLILAAVAGFCPWMNPGIKESFAYVYISQSRDNGLIHQQALQVPLAAAHLCWPGSG